MRWAKIAWEGDLLFGSNGSQIAALVERRTRYVMLVKVPSKDTETVINALIRHAQKLPWKLYKSLTWDRGKEMAAHRRFGLATDVEVFFCDPQQPRQLNERPRKTLHFKTPVQCFAECVASTG